MQTAKKYKKILAQTVDNGTVFCVCRAQLVVVILCGICYNVTMTKKVVLAVVAVATIAVLSLGLCACTLVVDGIDVGDYVGVQYTTYEYFNTYCTVSCYLPSSDKKAFEELWEGEIKEMIGNIEGCLSLDGENSDVAAFNAAAAGETIEISKTAFDAFFLAKEAYGVTGGAFNPAIALSVDLWGFSPRFNEGDYVASEPYDRKDYKNELPSDEYVAAFAGLSDFSQTEIREEDGAYFVRKADVTATVGGEVYTQQLDLSGIGKGYCADAIAAVMRKHGYKFGYVNIGGSSMTMLKNARKESGADLGEWSAKVLSPLNDGSSYFKAYLKDVSLATSGGYQQNYEIKGVRYSHILDPFTGAPYASDVLTATVYGENAALADAYSTAMCVLGKDGAVALAGRLEGYTYTLAYDDGKGGFRVLSNADGALL